MKVITRQFLANKTLERWNMQYPKGKDGIEAKLKALGDNPSPDSVDRVIGNGSWTALPVCSECCVINLPVVQMSGEDDDVHFCRNCLEQALKL